MFLRALVLSIVVAGCHHDPPPAPPITPEPRTPVGYLLDAASQLELSVDQVARLKVLDIGLAQRLAVLDPQIAALMKAQAGSGDAQSTTSSGGGTRGMGGMRGMGGARRGNRGGGSNGASGSGKGDALDRLLAQRDSDVRATLELALSALDPKQQVIAKQQLADHDVDLDDNDADDGSDGKGNGNGSGNTNASGNSSADGGG
jgi:hypothetical protein